MEIIYLLLAVLTSSFGIYWLIKRVRFHLKEHEKQENLRMMEVLMLLSSSDVSMTEIEILEWYRTNGDALGAFRKKTLESKELLIILEKLKYMYVLNTTTYTEPNLRMVGYGSSFVFSKESTGFSLEQIQKEQERLGLPKTTPFCYTIPRNKR